MTTRGACNNCDAVGDSVSNCLKERESSNASCSGGGDPHCLMYTNDQFQSITMLEKVGPVVEQSNITELLLDSRAACRVRPCRVTAGYACEDAVLTATGPKATFQGTLEVKSQRVDVLCEKINVTTCIKLMPVKSPIMSVFRPVGKEVVVIMKCECQYKSYNKNREKRSQKFSCVYQIHESDLSGLYSLKSSNVDGHLAETWRETITLSTRRPPIQTHKGGNNATVSQSVIYHSELGVFFA